MNVANSELSCFKKSTTVVWLFSDNWSAEQKPKQAQNNQVGAASKAENTERGEGFGVLITSVSSKKKQVTAVIRKKMILDPRLAFFLKKSTMVAAHFFGFSKKN